MSIISDTQKRQEKEIKKYTEECNALTEEIIVSMKELDWSAQQAKHYVGTVLPELVYKRLEDYLIKQKLSDIT